MLPSELHKALFHGPNDFKLIINDLQFDIGYVKFVDDRPTTTFSVSNDPHNCLLQKPLIILCRGQTSTEWL